MPARVAAVLKKHFKRSEYTGADDLVLPSRGRRTVRRLEDEEAFKDAIKAAGFAQFASTTFATPSARGWLAGAPLRTIQEWMGHRDHKTTEIYADYAPDPVQGARWAEAA